jgi:hypothetical protein
MSVTEQRASAFAPEAVPLGIEPGTLNEALFSFGWNESGTAGCERQEGKKRREAPLLSARSKSSKGVAHGGKVPVCPSEGLIRFQLNHACRGTYGRKRREPHIRHQAARCLGAKQAENR